MFHSLQSKQGKLTTNTVLLSRKKYEYLPLCIVSCCMKEQKISEYQLWCNGLTWTLTLSAEIEGKWSCSDAERDVIKRHVVRHTVCWKMGQAPCMVFLFCSWFYSAFSVTRRYNIDTWYCLASMHMLIIKHYDMEGKNELDIHSWSKTRG
jgi:hypothetical protein